MQWSIRYFSLTVLMTLVGHSDVVCGTPEPVHWYKGNTHTHTHAFQDSDADGPPGLVAAWYRDHGYQFVVITDHEYLTDVGSLNDKFVQAGKFIVIAGQEITKEVM